MDLKCAVCLKEAYKKDLQTGVPSHTDKASAAETLVEGTAYCAMHNPK